MTAIFGTERLIARRWEAEDADAAFAIYGDPEVARYGFDVLGLDALYALVHPDNPRSIRVCERIGMRHIGRRSSAAGYDEEFFVAERPTWPASIP